MKRILFSIVCISFAFACFAGTDVSDKNAQLIQAAKDSNLSVKNTALSEGTSLTSQQTGQEDYQSAAYQSQYVIPALKEIMGPTSTKMNVTLEATGDPNILNVTGSLEWEMPQLDFNNAKRDEKGVLHPDAKGPMKLKTWYPGARHTIKGKLQVHGYTFVSDNDNPLVFWVMQNCGYVYESGQGTVTTPTGEKILLRSIALSPEQVKSAESAIKDGSIETFREMLKKDTQLTSGRLWAGRTLLFNAVYSGRADIVRLLIDHGADVNAVNCFGQTPLFNAVTNKNTVEGARVLLEKGANVNAVDYDGRTPLHDAAFLSSAEMVRLLLNFGAKVNVKDNKGETPIYLAVMFEKDETVKLIKEAKGDLDGAIADYTKAIELKPDYFTYIQRGYVKQVKGDLDGAIADYTKAIELKPDFPQAYNNRGVAKQVKGDLDGAKADYRQVLKIRPDYREVQKHLDELNNK